MQIIIKLQLNNNQVAAFEHVLDLRSKEEIEKWASGEVLPLVYAVEAEYDDYLAEQAEVEEAEEEAEKEEDDGYGDDAG